MFPPTSRSLNQRRQLLQFVIYLAIGVTILLLGLLWQLQRSPMTHAQSQPDALGSLSGTVRNAQGDPLPNVEVLLQHYRFQYGSRTVTTNAQGVYQFLSLQSGVYRIQFQDPQEQYASEYYMDAYFTGDATNVSVNGNHVTGIDSTLEVGGAISVTLQNSPEITTTLYELTLYRQNAGGAWTNYSYLVQVGENSARFETLPAGSYRLCVRGYDYLSYVYTPVVECYDNVRPESFTSVAPDAADINVQAGVEQAITVRLGDNPQIEGYVTNRQAQPLANIPVALFPYGSYPQQIVTTDSNGYFSFPYIPDGLYSLVFNTHYFGLNNYLPVYYPGYLSPSDAEAILVDNNTHISTTVQLRPTARITGKVTLPGDVPVDWTTISLYRQHSNGAWSDPWCSQQCPTTIYDPSTGVFTVTNLAAGTFRVRADAYVGGSSYLMGFYGGESFETADDVTANSGQIAAGINIVVGEHEFDASIRGTVMGDGAPLEGIEVGLFNQSYAGYQSVMPLFTTTTDQQGRYSLEGLTFGYYQVAFRDPQGIYATTFYSNPTSFDYMWIPVTSTGVTDNIDVELTPGGTIRGHIRTQGGKHPGGFTMQVIHYNDPYAIQPLPYIDEKSDATGFFEITGLPPGNYSLMATTPDGSGEYPPFVSLFYPNDPYPQQTLEVKAGQTQEGKDFFFFFEPNVFLPVIEGNAAVADPGPLPFPPALPGLPIPVPPAPIPTPTPDLSR
jgi:hypothetical protein